MTTIYGALGVSPTLRGQPTNVFNLKAGQTWLIPPGTWNVLVSSDTGAGGTPSETYSTIQQFDSIQNAWRNVGPSLDGFKYVNSDGVNYRIANQTGCVVGALLTTAGTGYTSAPIVTDNGGGGTVYQAILGPVVATSVTVTSGGTGYTYPPLVMISAPSAPGVQATGSATIAAGVVTAITITDQGAGYTSPPVFSLLNDPRDSTGSGASASGTTTGSGTVAAVIVVDHGSPITSATVVPTISFSGGGGASAAATAIMQSAITAYTVTSAGSGYAGNVEVSAIGGFPATAPAYTNPKTQSNLVRGRKACILANLSGATITATSQIVYDGGIYTGFAPSAIVSGFAAGTGAVQANLAFTYGGVAETVSIYAI